MCADSIGIVGLSILWPSLYHRNHAVAYFALFLVVTGFQMQVRFLPVPDKGQRG